MIGGNEYDEKADAELMIRWTQLNALLPSMQFSLAPWDYGEESDLICRQYADLHTEFAPKILEIAGESIRDGLPIIRPVFWLAPSDEQALTCGDEFLLGDQFLVAPILTANTAQRNIYLPPGTWQDYGTNQEFTGPVVLRDYPSALDVLPIFKRIRQVNINNG
jgi:alpha-glucosidase (family GH31 glycosyl hydrolase)